MVEQGVYDVIIIGGGPAGLSAAARAHHRNMAYLLLEKDRLANTIDYYYQQGKFVMALPANIPLRSDLSFEAGGREAILRMWKNQVGQYQLNHRHEEVASVTKRKDGRFDVMTVQQTYQAHRVVVAIGKKGNPNKLQRPGEALEHVSDRLIDPQRHEDQDILVVGGGDAAAEVALALSDQNQVYMSYRQSDFNPQRMNETLRGKLQDMMARGDIQIIFESSVDRIEPNRVVLDVPHGTQTLMVDQVFVLIGANLPTRFLEHCGVRFSADPHVDPAALPLIDERYQAVGVEGLHIIGALTGKDLIKPVMNQGYEVIEFIAGATVDPIDETELSKQLKGIPGHSVADKINTITSQIPFWAMASSSHLRELLLVSTVHRFEPGQIVFNQGDYSTTFYSVVEGEVEIEVSADQTVRRRQGEFFGEMSLISDVPRSAPVRAVAPSILLETPRNALLNLMAAEPAVKELVDREWMPRALQIYLAPHQPASAFNTLAQAVKWQTFKRGDAIFKEGDPGDAMYIIRSGVVKISTTEAAGHETVITHLSVGAHIGEMAILSADTDVRTATASAVNVVEVMHIPRDDLLRFADANPWLRTSIKQQIAQRALETALVRESPDSTSVLAQFSKHGVVESTDVLLIDESKCIRCDNCVDACAATHGGQSRLDRKHGPSFASVHVPVACRHCVGAPCLADCPPGDAIMRDQNGVVRIDEQKCIGCGNCANYCPYGVIFMVEPPKPSLWQRWFEHRDTPSSGADSASLGETEAPVTFACEQCASYDYAKMAEHRETAIKCDLCETLAGGPACVRSCPTGAAIRVKQDDLPMIDFTLRMRV